MTLDQATDAVGAQIILKDNTRMAAKKGATATLGGVAWPYIEVEWDRDNPRCRDQRDGLYLADKFGINTRCP